MWRDDGPLSIAGFMFVPPSQGYVQAQHQNNWVFIADAVTTNTVMDPRHYTELYTNSYAG